MPLRSTSPRCTCAIEAAATAGPRLANACVIRAFQRGRDHGFGLGLRERRQPVLQAFEVARQHDADHVGPGGEKLSELEIGRARAASARATAAGRIWRRGARSSAPAAAPIARAAAPATDRRRRTRPHARTRTRRGRAARCGTLLKSQTPARMQVPRCRRKSSARSRGKSRPGRSSRQTRRAWEIGGSIPRDTDRTRHRRSPRGRAAGSP